MLIGGFLFCLPRALNSEVAKHGDTMTDNENTTPLSSIAAEEEKRLQTIRMRWLSRVSGVLQHICWRMANADVLS